MQDSRATDSIQKDENPETITITSTRFGQIQVEKNRVIDFPEGILGFPDEKSFVILEHKPGSPFCWLQSASTPELAFVMISPLLIRKDYLDGLPASEKRLFEGEKDKHMALFAFVTIPKGQVQKMTANLLGPIVIDIDKRLARQLVLANSAFSTRHPILPEKD